MYTKDQKKSFRVKFWEGFKSYSARKRRSKRFPTKWVGDNTGIKHLNLKFHFDEKEALVCIDIVASDMDRRVHLFDKLETLRRLIENALGEPLIWDLQYPNESGKDISRIFLRMDGVNIYDERCWPDVMVFFFNKMIRIEPIIVEYKDYIDG